MKQFPSVACLFVLVAVTIVGCSGSDSGKSPMPDAPMKDGAMMQDGPMMKDEKRMTDGAMMREDK